MSSLPPSVHPAAPGARARAVRLNKFDARADRLLRIVLMAACAVVFLALVAIVIQLISGAGAAYSKFGLGFLTRTQWVPNLKEFGAWPYIYGTLVTSVCSLILATALGVAIGLFLSLLAPRSIAAVIGPLVEMLASIPSVVLGLIGIVLIAPFIRSSIEPPLHAVLGFLPLFGPPEPVGNSLFTASIVLTIMVLPIIAALTRDVFLTVPQELRDGAEALGATRWEVIRGVVLPTTMSGITAACVLGFGRAIGEAIAVAQVVGGSFSPHPPADLYKAGNTLAAVVATQFSSPANALHTSAMFYFAAILLVIGLLTNFTARMISRNVGRVW